MRTTSRLRDAPATPVHPKQGVSNQSLVPNFLTCAVRRVNLKSFASADVEHLGAFTPEYADDSTSVILDVKHHHLTGVPGAPICVSEQKYQNSESAS